MFIVCAHCGGRGGLSSCAFRVANTGERSLDWIEIKDACNGCIAAWVKREDPPSLATLNDRAASAHYKRRRSALAGGRS